MKNNYDQFYNYTEDQFAENEYFQQWVKYAHKDDEEFWNEYLYFYPYQQNVITSARKRIKVLIELEKRKPLSTNEKLILKKAIFKNITQPERSYNFFQLKSIQLLKLTAIISAIVLVPLYLVNKNSNPPNLITERTGAKQIKQIIMPDSSVVILHANSVITYPKEINNLAKREISLEGNAFFKVKHKADYKPFTVHANAVSIAVLGTEFIVNARNNATEIVLTKGKVKVCMCKKIGNDIYMHPGEKVYLDTIKKAFVKSTIDPILYTAWTDDKWTFSSTPLLDIANLIYEYYGIKTVFINQKLQQFKISAVIPITDLRSFINIIAKTLDVKITEKLNKLYVHY